MLKLLHQVAEPGFLGPVGVHLELALSRVDAEAPNNMDFLPVSQAKPQALESRAPHGDRETRVVILEGEIRVSGTDNPEVGDLALDMQPGKILLETTVRPAHDLAHRVDPRARWFSSARSRRSPRSTPTRRPVAKGPLAHQRACTTGDCRSTR